MDRYDPQIHGNGDFLAPPYSAVAVDIPGSVIRSEDAISQSRGVFPQGYQLAVDVFQGGK